jgi:hypothetical protein
MRRSVAHVVSTVSVLTLSGSCSTSSESSAVQTHVTYPGAYPATIVTQPGDFRDASGRLWLWKGPAQFASPQKQPPPDLIATATATPVDPREPRVMTRDELAKGLQAVRLIADQVYQLAEPDYELADRILSAVDANRVTNGKAPPGANPSAAGPVGARAWSGSAQTNGLPQPQIDQIRPQYIKNGDNRGEVGIPAAGA